MGRIDALRWNPHMDESLTVLLEAKECPEDELLVHLVKIQLVMDKVYHTRRDGEDQSLARFYLESCQTQLISIRNQIPQHLKTSSRCYILKPIILDTAPANHITQNPSCFISMLQSFLSTRYPCRLRLLFIPPSSIDLKAYTLASKQVKRGWTAGYQLPPSPTKASRSIFSSNSPAQSFRCTSFPPWMIQLGTNKWSEIPRIFWISSTGMHTTCGDVPI